MDVCFLVASLENFLCPIGGFVEARTVKYYLYNYKNIPKSDVDSVFYKPESFKIEDEFRISIFYPYDEDSELKHGSKRMKLFEKSIMLTLKYF